MSGPWIWDERPCSCWPWRFADLASWGRRSRRRIQANASTRFRSCLRLRLDADVGGTGGERSRTDSLRLQVFVDGQASTEIAHTVVVIEDDEPAFRYTRNREMTGLFRALIKVGVDMGEGEGKGTLG